MAASICAIGHKLIPMATTLDETKVLVHAGITQKSNLDLAMIVSSRLLLAMSCFT